jgi:large subunit ribosomal protein L17
MKHLSKGRKFSRVRKQRKALMKTLLGSLILHEKMTTTEAKAKEMKNFIDRIINKAKTANKVGKSTVIKELNTLLPKKAVNKLIGEFNSRFNTRKSGYVRVIKLPRRKSDGARMAVIEFV